MALSNMVESPRPRRFLPALTIGTGALACAACCAVPLLAALGLGAGAIGGLVAFVEPLGLVLVVAGLGMWGFSAWRQRTRVETVAPAGSVCATDGGCGCKASSQRNKAEPPAGRSCQLTEQGIADRLAEFRGLLQRSLVSRGRSEEGFYWLLRGEPEVEREVRALAAREVACCSFFEFDIRRDQGLLRWQVRAPAKEADMLEALYRTSDDIPTQVAP